MQLGRVLLLVSSVLLGDQSAAAWDFGKGDGRCFAEEFYEAEGKGTTYLTYYMEIDDTVGIVVSNRDWSIKDSEKYELTYFLDAGGYEDHASIGFEEYPGKSYGNKGFVTAFEPAFAAYFAKSTFLKIKRGETLVDHLDLAGSGNAVAKVRQCVAELKAAERKRKAEEEKFSHIPKDPFAGD